MFGSNDDKNTPAPSTPASAEKPAEKKNLFGWLRKKTQAPSSPEPQLTPVIEQPAAPATEVATPASEPVAPVSEVAAPVESPAIAVEPPVAAPAVVQPAAAPVKSAEEQRAGFLERLKQGLSKTSASLGEGMASLFLGKKAIDDD